MDDLVRQAMAKWPNVPDCYGWLALGSRGDWYMRDDRAQAAGPFAGEGSNVASRGAALRHAALIDFIGRNYAVDEAGRWFFQNGPQRVFVELDAAPWVLRVQRMDREFVVRTHTGEGVEAERALCDESGKVYLLTSRGLGLVHTLDTLDMADAVERMVWPLEQVQAYELPLRYGFVCSPQQRGPAL